MDKFKRLYKEDFTRIGIIRKSHGYKGHAKISVDDLYLGDLKNQTFVFIKIDGYKVPFRIESLEVARDTIIKFKNCDSSEAMDNYQLLELYLLTEDIQHIESTGDLKKDSYLSMNIIDKEHGDLGKIVRVDEYPQQLMAILINKNHDEIMIPLHEALITHFAPEENNIYMDLPEGLI